MPTAPCEECGATIPTDVYVCPECEHAPRRTLIVLGVAVGGIGGLLTIFIITAIIGIPMVILSLFIFAYAAIARPKPAEA